MKYWLKGSVILSVLVLGVVLSGQIVLGLSAQTNTGDYDDEVVQQTDGGEFGYKLEQIDSLQPDFGGAWVADNGRIQVGLVGSDNASESRAAIFQTALDLGLDGIIDVVPVNFSWKTLNETRDAIHELHQRNVDYKNDEWPIQMGIKTDLNKVQVDIPADDSKLTPGHHVVLEEIKKSYRDQVHFEVYDTPVVNQAECNWWYCNNPLRGGVGIKRTGGTGEIDCTAGFVVKGVSSGNPYLMTAGHCQPTSMGYTWRTELYNYTPKNIGNVIHNVHNLLYNDPTNRVDAMIIQIHPGNNWSTLKAILKRSGTYGLNGVTPPTYNESYSISYSPGALVGDKICISPAVTGGYPTQPNGGSCGKIHQIGVYITTSDGYTTIVNRAGYCSRGGDSGAPIYNDSNKARGIHRAAGQSSVICSNYKYYTPMSVIMTEFNKTGGVTFN